jgi:hypothetical protein
MKQSFQRPSLSVLQVKWSRFRLPPDNGVSSRRIHEGTPPKGQGIKFSGVGAKWQNGVAENAVKIVTWKARALMIHAPLHWPEEDPEPWPMAVSYAAHLYNNTPKQSTKTHKDTDNFLVTPNR